jgi:hypothetical protein
MVRSEGRGKQKVAETIRPFQQLGPLRLRAMQRPQLALRPSGYGARHVEGGRRSRPSGEDEGGQRGVGGIPPVDLTLEPADMTRFDPIFWRTTPRAHRELGLGDEQLVLEPADQRTQVRERGGKARLDGAEVGPEFVERAVDADAGRVLVYARTMGETGRSAVARTGVETRDDLASGRQGNWSKGELRPWTGQNEMCSTSLCLAS